MKKSLKKAIIAGRTIKLGDKIIFKATKTGRKFIKRISKIYYDIVRCQGTIKVKGEDKHYHFNIDSKLITRSVFKYQIIQSR